jgi:hypothetical protein
LNAVIAFGRAVLSLLIVFVFSLAERKNEKRKTGRYLAAAGKNHLVKSDRVAPVILRRYIAKRVYTMSVYMT